MGLHRFKKGLDLPMAGVPEQRIEDARSVGSVAVVAADYPGMKPKMEVAVGDAVRLGEILFEDKKQPGIRYTSPGSGTVIAIHRGAKRALQSVVVRLAGGDVDSVPFGAHSGQHPSSLARQAIVDLLVESGLWTALRARPYGRVAALESTPRSIFVTAMDSNPLAPDLETVLAGRESDFERGLHALGRLTEGTVRICRAPGSQIAAPRDDKFLIEEFEGPHPAGTVGLHIHALDPVDRNKLVWYAGLQDVVAIGRLFETGRLDPTRIISLGGPSVSRPRLLRTRLGASSDDLVRGELEEAAPASQDGRPETRTVSGSVLSGRVASGEIHGFLGRYHQQLSVIPEEHHRHFLGWLAPGVDRFSTTNLFLSRLLPRRRFALSTSTHGSERAIVPIGLYEKVTPFDLQPTFLLKALVMGDVERAEELGCLELEEEDLALCSFVCPGKTDYGPYLREALKILEKEG